LFVAGPGLIRRGPIRGQLGKKKNGSCASAFLPPGNSQIAFHSLNRHSPTQNSERARRARGPLARAPNAPSRVPLPGHGWNPDFSPGPRWRRWSAVRPVPIRVVRKFTSGSFRLPRLAGAGGAPPRIPARKRNGPWTGVPGKIVLGFPDVRRWARGRRPSCDGGRRVFRALLLPCP